ncbi:MAG: malto-oligosyltrehalose synthase [Desulfomonile tiedjei]|nr:malto-oligosyltrehalose synthase [Desulfomonile tiedjei]
MRVPVATYRIQFSPSFGFEDARKVVPYLAKLGVTHLYASPIFKARKGSQHGYDVVDPNQLNPELGSVQDFEHLVDALKEKGMDWVQDVVPNHMAFDSQNEMLMDILESGQRSGYFPFFDIDWEHSYENIKGRVLAPFLGRFYGQTLEDGEITLHYAQEGLAVRYFHLVFPVSIDYYASFFSHGLGSLKKKLGEDHPDFIKLLGVLYVLRTITSEESIEGSYYQQVKFIKRMLWDLYSSNSDFKAFVRKNLRAFNGERGNPDSFALLDDLLFRQHFRLSFWKIATKEINYRRFFNVNDLISVKVEEQGVLEHTHRLTFDLIDRGHIAGLRIDHVDGLHDPHMYLQRIRSRAPDIYVLVEKILDPNEDLPHSWPVQGTTGYDFLNYVNALFCVRRNERTFRRIYSEFTGARVHFGDLAREKKRLIILEHMAGDVNNLAQLLKTVSSRDRHGMDVTLYGLRRALMEVLAAFPVYRTYTHREAVADTDREYIRTAIAQAVSSNPALFDELMFIKRFLLLEYPAYLEEAHKADWLKVAMRFQQLTGPLMAKGFEDTALYVYNRLLSLNEVGGRPDLFGCPVKRFHRFNRKRQRRWPDTLNATATHDTKRGEDVRARINVLSEIPAEWESKIKLWSRLNRNKKTRLKRATMPDKNDEYFLYQTLVGAFPFGAIDYPAFVERICSYIIKAVREAKVHTAWIKPDAEYEEAYLSFAKAILEPSKENLFLPEFVPFQKKIAHYGILNSLSQVLIKMTSPGVPDLYQGTELWDLSLVDPDNRRPVDFRQRASWLRELSRQARSGLLGLVQELLSHKEDGRVKLFLIAKVLEARNFYSTLFQRGVYVGLRVSGTFANHIMAFAREESGSWSLTIAPRFLTSVVEEGALPLGREVWPDTEIVLPPAAPSEWTNVLTNQPVFTGNSHAVAEALEHFPVALLVHSKNRSRAAPRTSRRSG